MLHRAGVFFVVSAIVLVASGLVAQQTSDDVQKKLDEMMKRLEQQEERLREQQKIIDSLRGQGARPAEGAKGAESFTPKQEKRVEDLVNQYLTRDEVRVNLGLEGVVAGYKDGFFLASRDQAYKLRLGGLIQLDGRFPDDWTASTFVVRRARPLLEATVAKYYNFRLEPDFGMGTVVLQDAFMDLGYFGDYSTTRLGKFKVPQGIEALASDRDLPFIERSLVNLLEPARDVGVMTWGRPFNGLLEYSFAVWNGNDRTPWQGYGRDSDRDNNSDKDYGGRLQVNPFRLTPYPWLKNIQLGGWFNQGHEEDVPTGTQSVLSFTTAPGTTWFRTPTNVRADGDRSRVGWDATWFLGPVCLAGEMEWMRQNLKSVDPTSIVGPSNTSNPGLWNASGVGWQNQIVPFNAWLIEATWLITGEDATWTGVKPKNNFDPQKGTWGAFEVGARYSRLDIGSHVFDSFYPPSRIPYIATQANSTNGAGELTLGLNWYLNRNVKLMFDYVYTAFDTPIPISRPSGFGGSKLFSDESAFLFRSQIRF